MISDLWIAMKGVFARGVSRVKSVCRSGSLTEVLFLPKNIVEIVAGIGSSTGKLQVSPTQKNPCSFLDMTVVIEVKTSHSCYRCSCHRSPLVQALAYFRSDSGAEHFSVDHSPRF